MAIWTVRPNLAEVQGELGSPRWATRQPLGLCQASRATFKAVLAGC